MSLESQRLEGEALVGKRVLVEARPGSDCHFKCNVLGYWTGTYLTLCVQPVAGSGTLRVRSWMPEEDPPG